jgi:hypothetical protein
LKSKRYDRQDLVLKKSVDSKPNIENVRKISVSILRAEKLIHIRGYLTRILK